MTPPERTCRRSAFQIAAGLDEDGNYLDGTGEQEAKYLAGLGWHERKRYETLKREWEKWRYQRSKLPRDQRPKQMMRIGERVCKWCGAFFEPDTLRQRFCKDFKPGNPHYCRQMHHKKA